MLTLKEQIHQIVEQLDGSICLQVSSIMRLVTYNNVNEVMEVLPDDFRYTFIEYVDAMYGNFGCPLDKDDFVTIGTGDPIDEEPVLAIHNWLRTTLIR